MKKILLFTLVVSLFLIGCTNSPKNEKENLALIEKYVQSVEDLDYDVMESILDDEYMGYGPSVNDSINKTQAVESWKYNVEYLYESIEYQKSRNATVHVDSGENAGEWVSNWGQLKIVYKSDKSEVIIWANTVYQIKNGKIVKSLSFYNEADVLEQLGYSFY